MGALLRPSFLRAVPPPPPLRLVAGTVSSFELVKKFWQAKNVVDYDTFVKLADAERALAFSTALKFEMDLLDAVLEDLRATRDEGLTGVAFREKLAETMDRFGRSIEDTPADRIELIYYQETIDAQNGGIYGEMFSPEGMQLAEVWEFHATAETVEKDPDEVCSLMNGRRFWKDDPASWEKLPQLHFRCVAEDTPVEGLFRTGFRSLYSGQMVEIETASRRRLTVTADHPIFTEAGLVPARSVHEGAYLFRYGRKEHPFSGVDDQNAPPKAAEAFNALKKAGARAVAPLGRVNLYGNAGRREGEIEVVTLDRMLADHAREERREFAFVATGARNRPSEAERVTPDLFIRNHSASGCAPRGAALPFEGAPVASATRPFQGLRFGATARLDALLLEVADDDSSRHTALVREALDRDAGLVSFDQVVHVREVDAVMRPTLDFEAAHGVIVANGLAIGNCRCQAISIPYEDGMEVEGDPGGLPSGDKGFDHDKLGDLEPLFGPLGRG